MVLCPDIISFPESTDFALDRWVLLNAFVRSALGVAPEVFPVLAAVDQGIEDLRSRFGDRYFRIWDIARFSHIDGLLADPSRFQRGGACWGDPKLLTVDELVETLRKHYIVIEDIAAYRAGFAPKRSLVDGAHFGNLHQQIGQHLMLIRRVQPTAWWVEQKFLPDLSGMRPDTLYGQVQEAFLDRILPDVIVPGCRVLDIGCGPGVISRKIARLGAHVLGVDPHAPYIELARRCGAEASERPPEFEVCAVGQRGGLDHLPDGSFDVVIITDALLLYYVPYGPEKTADIRVLVADIRRLLVKGGVFLSLEPHPAFYMAPWLGTADRPFTVLTEYLSRQWRIHPPLSALVRPFLAAGFAIVDLEEVVPPAGGDAGRSRAEAFAAEFPLWLFTKFRLLDGSPGR